MTAPPRVVRLDQLEGYGFEGRPTWLPIRSQLGIDAFGVNAWQATEPDQELIGEHDEVGPRAQRHEELYFVVKGRATFTVDGETIDAPAGTVVLVRDPAAKRGALAEEDGTTVLTVGGRPGEAFTPSTWERSAPALAFFATQEYEKAQEALRKAHEEFPDDPTVLFNLACAESLLGRAGDAVDHLGQSIAIDERFREFAQTDSDFDLIRDDPRFKELVG